MISSWRIEMKSKEIDDHAYPSEFVGCAHSNRLGSRADASPHHTDRRGIRARELLLPDNAREGLGQVVKEYRFLGCFFLRATLRALTGGIRAGNAGQGSAAPSRWTKPQPRVFRPASGGATRTSPLSAGIPGDERRHVERQSDLWTGNVGSGAGGYGNRECPEAESYRGHISVARIGTADPQRTREDTNLVLFKNGASIRFSGGPGEPGPPAP